jgi:dolichyl-phosphate-mannose-protein mannosyltransferase
VLAGATASAARSTVGYDPGAVSRSVTDESAVAEAGASDASDAAVAPGPTKRVALAILVLLSAQFAVLSAVEAWRDAPTFDEVFHLASGATALTRHQWRLTPEHDALPKVLGAGLALLARPAIPDNQAWQDGDGNAYYGAFLAAQKTSGKVQRVFFLARLVSIAEAIALGFALYALARGLFGRTAGLVAAGAWLTTPLAVAFGHIDGSDLPFALAVVLTCLALQRWYMYQTVGRLVLVGVAASAMLLTRFTGLALVPGIALAVAIGAVGASVLRRAAMALSVPLIAWAGVWAVYRVISPMPVFRHAVDYSGYLPESKFSRLARVVPWPKEYAVGLEETGRLASASSDIFLFGRHASGAQWWYWPGALLVKLPLPATLLAVAACGYWVVSRRRARVQALLTVVVPLAIVVALVVPYKRPSFRYFLPGLVLLFVLGAAVLAAASRYKVGRVVLAALAVVQLVSLWNAFPHSLAWTTPPFRPNYRVVGDTNDWGQDYYRLEHWATGKDALVAYFGPFALAPPIPGTRPLAGAEPNEIRGWVAVSMSNLTYQSLSIPKDIAWLRTYCPIGTLGGSILVYRFREPPDTTRAASVAARPCHGDYSEPVPMPRGNADGRGRRSA